MKRGEDELVADDQSYSGDYDIVDVDADGSVENIGDDQLIICLNPPPDPSLPFLQTPAV